MKYSLQILAFLVLVGFGLRVAAEPPSISSIVFEGNNTTKERILLQEMSVKVGDPADSEAIERSRQSIMNLGLFKSVRTELIDEPGGQQLRVVVQEKYFVLPIPRVEGKPDGNYQYGAELRFDNLAGLNQRLRLIYLVHDTIDDVEPVRKEASIRYSYPRVGGSAYNFGLSGEIERQEPDLIDGDVILSTYRQENRNIAFSVSRWLRINGGPSRGWNVGTGLGWSQKYFELLDGAPLPFETSQAVSVNGSIRYDDVQDEGFYRSGDAYGVTLDIAAPGLGSDYDYRRSLLYWRNYKPLGDYRNFNTRLQLGLASGSAFGGRAYSIGGRDLRGYDKGYADGNAMLLSNNEYLHPINGYRQFRGILFLDIGNAYERVKDIDLTELKTGVGFGFRWKVQSFVDVDIAFDWGYGFYEESSFTYVGTHGTF